MDTKLPRIALPTKPGYRYAFAATCGCYAYPQGEKHDGIIIGTCELADERPQGTFVAMSDVTEFEPKFAVGTMYEDYPELLENFRVKLIKIVE